MRSTKSVEPDEMQLHLGLHCLQKYSVGCPEYKWLKACFEM